MRVALLTVLLAAALPACRKAPTARSPGEADLRRAMTLQAEGRFREAETAAAEAITHDPELGEAYAVYGGLVVRRGAIEEAEHAVERARRWAPESAPTLLLELELAAKAGQPARELAAEDKLVNRYPAEARFRHRRALTLMKMGEAKGAAKDARFCLRLEPGNLPCRCLAGNAAAKLGEMPGPDAEAACQAVGGVHP